MSRVLQYVGSAMLLSLSIPLAVLATLTTAIAVIALLGRVSIVYFELGCALLHSWVFSQQQPGIANLESKAYDSASVRSPAARLHRFNAGGDGGSSSSSSRSTVAEGIAPTTQQVSSKVESFTPSVSSGALNRDFEGVGGWREPGDYQDDAVWMSMNVRLQLPTVDGERRRRHRRSLTSQSQRFMPSPEVLRMSPHNGYGPAIQTGDEPDGYFSIPPAPQPTISPEEVAAKRMDHRRLSIGSTSGSSAHTNTVPSIHG